MKLHITCGLAFAFSVMSAFSSFAQPPSAQAPDAQVKQQLQNMPFMDGMMELQEKYKKIENQRKLERKAITDKIYEEELVKQKEKHAAMGASGFNYDPYGASEVAARQRLEALYAQWAREDQELKTQMQEEMMSSTGMGDMLKQQREMTKKYGYPAPSGYPAVPSK
jgi:hypothetical protein